MWKGLKQEELQGLFQSKLFCDSMNSSELCPAQFQPLQGQGLKTSLCPLHCWISLIVKTPFAPINRNFPCWNLPLLVFGEPSPLSLPVAG